MELQTAISKPPLVHRGGTGVWALSPEPLEFIWENIEEGWDTVETGIGLSTVVFSLKRSNHFCITPNSDEVERLKKYCVEHSIPLDQVTFIVDGSQNVVHTLPLDEIDFALIDGGHGFPLPFIDWFYVASSLRVGGLLMIDDTQLWTGKVLKEFLQLEPGWRLEKNFSRTTVFRLTAPFSYSEWTDQRYVRIKSWWPTNKSKLDLAIHLFFKGDWPRLWAGVAKERKSRVLRAASRVDRG